TLEASTTTLGRPILLPLALAFLIPARTRSAIRLRSSSATAPSTVKPSSGGPAGVCLLRQGDKIDPRERCTFPEREVGERLTRRSELPDGHGVKAPPVRVAHEPVKLWP